MKSHPLKMELNRVTHLDLDFLHGLTGRDASVEPYDVRTRVGARILDHDGVLGQLGFLSSPACLTMLARVILTTSSPNTSETPQSSFVE